MSNSKQLTEAERQIALAVNAAAFVNPFSADRETLERDLAEKVSSFAPQTAHGRWSEGLFGWLRQLPEKKKDLQSLQSLDRELMRIVFLFTTYHHFLHHLDDLIFKQLEQEHSVKVPFARECLEMLGGFSFNETE